MQNNLFKRASIHKVELYIFTKNFSLKEGNEPRPEQVVVLANDPLIFFLKIDHKISFVIIRS